MVTPSARRPIVGRSKKPNGYTRPNKEKLKRQQSSPFVRNRSNKLGMLSPLSEGVAASYGQSTRKATKLTSTDIALLRTTTNTRTTASRAPTAAATASTHPLDEANHDLTSLSTMTDNAATMRSDDLPGKAKLSTKLTSTDMALLSTTKNNRTRASHAPTVAATAPKHPLDEVKHDLTSLSTMTGNGAAMRSGQLPGKAKPPAELVLTDIASRSAARNTRTRASYAPTAATTASKHPLDEANHDLTSLSTMTNNAATMQSVQLSGRAKPPTELLLTNMASPSATRNTRTTASYASTATATASKHPLDEANHELTSLSTMTHNAAAMRSDQLPPSRKESLALYGDNSVWDSITQIPLKAPHLTQQQQQLVLMTSAGQNESQQQHEFAPIPNAINSTEMRPWRYCIQQQASSRHEAQLASNEMVIQSKNDHTAQFPLHPAFNRAPLSYAHPYVFLTLSILSIICISSLSLHTPSRLRSTAERLVMACAGTSAILSLLMFAALRNEPSQRAMTRSISVEVANLGTLELKSLACISAILFLILWTTIGTIVILIPTEDIGVVGGGMEIWNANLYFSTRFGFWLSCFMFADGCVSASNNNSNGISRSGLAGRKGDSKAGGRNKIGRGWILLMICSLVLVVSSTTLLGGPICTSPTHEDFTKCSRLAFGIVFGILGVILAGLYWVVLLAQRHHHSKSLDGNKKYKIYSSGRVEKMSSVLSALSLCSFAVNAGFLTDSAARWSEPCNIYFASWACFGLSASLILRHVEIWSLKPWIQCEGDPPRRPPEPKPAPEVREVNDQYIPLKHAKIQQYRRRGSTTYTDEASESRSHSSSGVSTGCDSSTYPDQETGILISANTPSSEFNSSDAESDSESGGYTGPSTLSGPSTTSPSDESSASSHSAMQYVPYRQRAVQGTRNSVPSKGGGPGPYPMMGQPMLSDPPMLPPSSGPMLSHGPGSTASPSASPPKRPDPDMRSYHGRPHIDNSPNPRSEFNSSDAESDSKSGGYTGLSTLSGPSTTSPSDESSASSYSAMQYVPHRRSAGQGQRNAVPSKGGGHRPYPMMGRPVIDAHPTLPPSSGSMLSYGRGSTESPPVSPPKRPDPDMRSYHDRPHIDNSPDPNANSGNDARNKVLSPRRTRSVSDKDPSKSSHQHRHKPSNHRHGPPLSRNIQQRDQQQQSPSQQRPSSQKQQASRDKRRQQQQQKPTSRGQRRKLHHSGPATSGDYNRPLQDRSFQSSFRGNIGSHRQQQRRPAAKTSQRMWPASKPGQRARPAAKAKSQRRAPPSFPPKPKKPSKLEPKESTTATSSVDMDAASLSTFGSPNNPHSSTKAPRPVRMNQRDSSMESMRPEEEDMVQRMRAPSFQGDTSGQQSQRRETLVENWKIRALPKAAAKAKEQQRRRWLQQVGACDEEAQVALAVAGARRDQHRRRQQAAQSVAGGKNREGGVLSGSVEPPMKGGSSLGIRPAPQVHTHSSKESMDPASDLSTGTVSLPRRWQDDMPGTSLATTGSGGSEETKPPSTKSTATITPSEDIRVRRIKKSWGGESAKPVPSPHNAAMPRSQTKMRQSQRTGHSASAGRTRGNMVESVSSEYSTSIDSQRPPTVASETTTSQGALTVIDYELLDNSPREASSDLHRQSSHLPLQQKMGEWENDASGVVERSTSILASEIVKGKVLTELGERSFVPYARKSAKGTGVPPQSLRAPILFSQFDVNHSGIDGGDEMKEVILQKLGKDLSDQDAERLKDTGSPSMRTRAGKKLPISSDLANSLAAKTYISSNTNKGSTTRSRAPSTAEGATSWGGLTEGGMRPSSSMMELSRTKSIRDSISTACSQTMPNNRDLLADQMVTTALRHAQKLKQKHDTALQNSPETSDGTPKTYFEETPTTQGPNSMSRTGQKRSDNLDMPMSCESVTTASCSSNTVKKNSPVSEELSNSNRSNSEQTHSEDFSGSAGGTASLNSGDAMDDDMVLEALIYAQIAKGNSGHQSTATARNMPSFHSACTGHSGGGMSMHSDYSHSDNPSNDMALWYAC